jgi:histidine triad (HIT) family protein
MEEDRISAVQYIKFALDEEAQRRFCDPNTLARVRVSHPNYQREAEIPPATRESLIRSLRSEVEPLLSVDSDPQPAATEPVVFETGAVRAVRPERPLAPGHLIIEPIQATESLLTVEDEVLTELMAAVKRAAEEIVRVHGACRVYTDLGGHGSRLRWHVFAPPS